MAMRTGFFGFFIGFGQSNCSNLAGKVSCAAGSVITLLVLVG